MDVDPVAAPSSTSTTSDDRPPVTIVAGDNSRTVVSYAAAIQSVTLRNLLEDISTGEVPAANVENAHIMEIIKTFIEHRALNPMPVPQGEPKKPDIEYASQWDKQFIESLTQPDLFGVIMAANFLEIKELLDLGCKCVAKMIQGKTPEELRVQFNLKNEFTPEEEKKVREENEWVDENVGIRGDKNTTSSSSTTQDAMQE